MADHYSRPRSNGGLAPLANFGTVTFTDAFPVINGVN